MSLSAADIMRAFETLEEELSIRGERAEIVIAGGAGGYLKTGQAVNLDSKTLGTGNSEASCSNGTDVGFGTGSQGGNVPLNKLYVTLLNAIGATNAGQPITTFGVCDSNDVEAGITKPGELDLIKA